MSWMSALSAWQWVVMLAVPPFIFLLYFLKLRRKPLEVPSTYLWRRAIEDMHVNSLWQRLRRNLLLFLQLLFLAALIFACLRPGIHGNQATGRRWILMIDNSASMQATDLPMTRLEFAKSKAKDQIALMNRGDVAMVIAFSDRADIQQGFTGDTHRLLAAVSQISATNRTTDINEAFRAAAGLANPGRVSFDGMNDIQVAEALPATVFVYSDGGFPPLAEFERGNLSIEYVPTGTATIDNVAIEAFAVTKNEERTDELEAYARLSNYGADKVELTASLYFDKTLIDAVNAVIEPGKDSGLKFSLENQAIESGVFRLEIDRADQLLIDNQAFSALKPSRYLNVVVVTPGNFVLEKALSTSAMRSLAKVKFELPSSLEEKTGGKPKAFEEFDLVIFDQCKPQVMPQTNTLFIGEQPPSNEWTLGDTTWPIQLIDFDRSHPITAFLEVNSISIVDGRPIGVPESGQVLIRAVNGPMFAVAPRGPFQDAVLGFEIVRSAKDGIEMNTDWGKQRSFPVFIYGCVEFLAGGATPSAASNTLPGQPIGITIASRFDRYEVVDPTGHSVEVDRSDSGQIVWTATELLGVYKVQAGSEKRAVDIFAVNLFSARESNLSIRPDLDLGDEKFAGSNIQTRARREYWRWLLLVGLCLLVGEWVIYNRRVLI